MTAVLLPVVMVLAFALGYFVAWRRGERRLADMCRDRPGRKHAVPQPIPDRSAYDAAYPPEQRERNRRQLKLMDEFATLQRKRNELIRKAGEVGYEILDGPDMARLKLETFAVLEKLIAYEPVGFYRDVYDELLAELSGADGPVLQ